MKLRHEFALLGLVSAGLLACSSSGGSGGALPCDDAGLCAQGFVCQGGFCLSTATGGSGGGSTGGSGGSNTGGSNTGGIAGSSTGGSGAVGGSSGSGGATGGFGGIAGSSGFGGATGGSGGATGGFGGSGATGGTGGFGGSGATGGTGGSGGSGGGTGVGTCCTVHSTPGCSNAAIQACVCAADSFCCNDHWDSQCVGEVTSEGCGSCGTGGSGGGGSSSGGGGTGGGGQLCGSVTCGSAATCCTCSGTPICITLPSGTTCAQFCGG